MHMSDFAIHHIQYVTLPPHPDRNTPNDLFQLLDKLDVFERDRMLTWMYLAFLEAPVTQDTAETEEQRGLSCATTSSRKVSSRRFRRIRALSGPCGRDLHPGLSSRVR